MLDNYKMKNNQQIVRALVIIIFLLSLTIIFVGLNDFYTGFHNIDLGSNMRYLEVSLDINLLDLGSDGRLRNGIEVYSLGMDYLKRSLIELLAGVFLSGLSFWEIARGYLK